MSPEMMVNHDFIRGAPLSDFKTIGEHFQSGVRLTIQPRVVVKTEACDTFPVKFVLKRDVVVGKGPGPPYASLLDEHGQLLPGAMYLESSNVNVLMMHTEVIVEERRERRLRISKYFIPKFVNVPASFPDSIVPCCGWITEKTLQGVAVFLLVFVFLRFCSILSAG